MSDDLGGDTPYPEVDQQPDYPRLEERVLAFWEADGDFRRLGGGPGRRGQRVRLLRRAPLRQRPPPLRPPAHGLREGRRAPLPDHARTPGRAPLRLGLPRPAGRDGGREGARACGAGPIIVAYGIDRFNDYCRGLVQRTTDAWERYVTRQARWVDFADDYKTMDLSYMESVMWAFKRAVGQGPRLRGRAGPALLLGVRDPAVELRDPPGRRLPATAVDPAVTVAFDLDPTPDRVGAPVALTGPLRLLVWTTTPWTLPSNLALAVGPEVAYDIYELLGHPTAVAAERATAYPELFAEAEPLGRVTGAELVGRTYRPLFDFFADHPGAFRVLPGISWPPTRAPESSTWLPASARRTTSPARRRASPSSVPSTTRAASPPRYRRGPVSRSSRPTAPSPRRCAIRASSSTPPPTTHSYPHCWRTDTPLIYKAVELLVRDRDGHQGPHDRAQRGDRLGAGPCDATGAFGKWLEGARDWSISRNRFWGAPIPVWKSDDPRYPRIDVYGSLDELERDFGVRPTDLHRPAIDELVRPNPDDPTGRSTGCAG